MTEVGRQPWIVYNVMRTEDAVTKASGVGITFAVVVRLYAALGAALIVTLRAMARRWRDGRRGRRRRARTARIPPPDVPPRIAA